MSSQTPYNPKIATQLLNDASNSANQASTMFGKDNVQSLEQTQKEIPSQNSEPEPIIDPKILQADYTAEPGSSALTAVPVSNEINTQASPNVQAPKSFSKINPEDQKSLLNLGENIVQNGGGVFPGNYNPGGQQISTSNISSVKENTAQIGA